MNSIPLCAPEITGNEWDYVKDCLDTSWVSSSGSYVGRFERDMAEFLGVEHAVATSSGTAALHVALLLSDVSPNDEVIISDLTFIAPANAVRYVNAWPVFIDAECLHWQIDPAKIQGFIEQQCEFRGGVLRNQVTGRRIKAILPVHILGHPVDMDPILKLSDDYGLEVIEDATESLGASYRGRKVGTIGTIGCFSFNGNKLITTGGGGMIVTDDPLIADRARQLTTQAKIHDVEYIHSEVAFNYRLTNVQAAIGCAQLEQIDLYISRKKEIAERYGRAFKGIPGLKPMSVARSAQSVFWMYTIRIDPNIFGMSSREVMSRLHSKGIESRPLWQPMHLSPPHKISTSYSCENSEDLYENCLSIPCSVGLSSMDQNRVISAICDALPEGVR